MPERRSKLSTGALALGAVAGIALVTSVGAPACFPKGACDEVVGEFYCGVGSKLCPGRLVDDRTWESNSIDGTWLFYPKNSTFQIDPRGPDGKRVKGRMVSVVTWISVCEKPTVPGCNFVVAGGNNAKFWIGSQGTLYVKNDTCEDYYARVVIETDGTDQPFVDPDASTPDATATDASTSDATTDATTE